MALFNTLEEAFSALNNTVNYVVLRNFEELPQRADSDIDLLTDDSERVNRVLNPAKGIFRCRDKFKMNIGGQQITWNIHSLEKGAGHCPQWEKDMLQDKVLRPGNVYVLNDEHYFYSFVYDVLMYEKAVTKTHYTKAESLLQSLYQTGMVQNIMNDEKIFFDVFDYYFDLLCDYLKRKNYSFRLSHMSSKYRFAQCQSILNLPQIADRLAKKFDLCRIKPIFIARSKAKYHEKNHQNVKPEDRLTYYLAWQRGKKIFIKYGDRKCRGNLQVSYKMEYDFCNRLHNINERNFPEALFYSEDELYYCLAYDFLTGKTLGEKIKEADLSLSERESLLIQLKNIAQSLIDTAIAHNDLHLANFFVTDDGTLKLIDFGFATGGKFPEECPAFKQRSFFSSRSACVRCAKGEMHHLLAVLQAIGCQKSYQETYNEVESFLLKHQGKCPVRCKHHRFIFIFRTLYEIKRSIKKILNEIKQRG